MHPVSLPPPWLAVLAYGAGLALTLALASRLTPPRWWRRPTALALLILAGGGWGIGTVLLHLAGAAGMGIGIAGPAIAAQPAAPAVPAVAVVPAAEPAPGRPFQVHRDLNLRATAGVHGARLATVPAGAGVTPTGLRDGDWWQVRARVDGQLQTGWVSSLWLRRSGE